MLQDHHLESLVPEVTDNARTHKPEAASDQNLSHAARSFEQKERVASMNRRITPMGPSVMVA